MRYRKLDVNYDYTFGQGRSEILHNTPAAVGQSVLTRLQLWQGEWFLDSTEGTPWLQKILSANIKNTTPLYDQAIKSRVLTTQHVTALNDYSSNLNVTTRRLVVSMKIDTEYGGLSISATFGPAGPAGFIPALIFSNPLDSQYAPLI